MWEYHDGALMVLLAFGVGLFLGFVLVWAGLLGFNGLRFQMRSWRKAEQCWDDGYDTWRPLCDA